MASLFFRNLIGRGEVMPVTPRVLYVDDDAENCEMMKYWIREECGCEISIAMDGKEALHLIDSEFFDLFLLDYCLPDTTGIKLCETIRRLYPNAPIAVYSALDRDIDKQRAIAAGATSYLVKPEQLAEIKPFLAKHLDGPERELSIPKTKDDANAVQHRPRFRARGII